MPGIDLHTHLAPRLADAHDGVVPTADGRLEVDGHRVGLPDLYEPERLVTWLAERDLDEAVVSVPPPFFRQHLDAGAGAAWAAALNAGVLATTAAHEALTPLAYLPLEHPDVALREYRRVRDDARFAGVVGSAGGRSASLADPAFGPLWDLLHRDRRLLVLHPGASPDPRLDVFYLSNLLGNPVETAVAAAQLVFGDVLARWPDMRVLLVHCGGCVPGLVGRWELGVDTARPGVPELSEPPRAAVRRLFVDCLAHDDGAVDHAVRVFGEDRMVLGSDWPFPMGTQDPRALVAHRGAAFVARVAEANAAWALGR